VDVEDETADDFFSNVLATSKSNGLTGRRRTELECREDGRVRGERKQVESAEVDWRSVEQAAKSAV
jgi:hypothetical protein